MSAAHNTGQDAYIPNLRTEAAGRYSRLGVLLLAVCSPTAFWVLGLLLASNAAGVKIGTAALAGFGLAVGAFCFVTLAVVAWDLR